jgi:hypothetical protein
MYSFFNALGIATSLAITGWLVSFSNQFTCGCGDTYMLYESAYGENSQDTIIEKTILFVANPYIAYPIAALLPGLLLYKACHFKKDRRRTRRRKNRDFKKWKQKLERDYVMRIPNQKRPFT